jgi:hypothetical protein
MSRIEANEKTIENMSKFIRHPWKSVKTLFFELPLQKVEIIGGGAWNSSCEAHAAQWFQLSVPKFQILQCRVFILRTVFQNISDIVKR